MSIPNVVHVGRSAFASVAMTSGKRPLGLLINGYVVQLSRHDFYIYLSIFKDELLKQHYEVFYLDIR